MKGYLEEQVNGKDVFVGVDVHKSQWHVTIRTEEQEVFSGSIPGEWEALQGLLKRCKRSASRVKVVYEASGFGFWLHDHLVGWGCQCLVTPPSLMPQESGNRVKTDRRDSRKLAFMVAKGMLKGVWVPSRKERFHRQVSRRRRQLVKNRIRVQNQIKSELRFHGFPCPATQGPWSRKFVERLWCIRFGDRFMQESFTRLLEQFAFLSKQIEQQSSLLRELSETALYKDRLAILTSTYGIGVVTGMEILLELQDVARFRRGCELAAYVGLTPSQYSSGDKVRMGRITKAGKPSVRAALVESAWALIRKDGAMREKYETLKARSGAKRAIVAIARILLLRLRRMLLDGQPYAAGLVVSQ
ncbi:MAG: IS110 family transposase [Chloroflexota bacterium]